MDLLDTTRGRRILFTLLYLGEGAPIGFLWWALPTLMRDAGVPVDRIGWFSGMLVLPWGLKFLWSPLIDVSRGRSFGLRAWIVSSQALMVITLVPLLWLDLRGGFTVLVPILLAHAVAAATQDAAIDALAVSTAGVAERGRLNGWMQAGMLIGRACLGGGALIMAAHWGIRGAVLVLIGVVTGLLGLFPLFHVVETPSSGRFLEQLTTAGRRASTWFGILFASVSGAGFEAAGVLAGPLLIDRGFSAAVVGVFFALPAVLAMVAGALVGGRLADRWDRRRAVMASLGILSLALLALAGLSTVGSASAAFYWATLTAVYLGIGLFTASSYALFMDMTDPRLGATQFSAFMSATNLCEAWAAHAGGRLAAGLGYPAAFGLMTVVSLFSIPLLILLGGRRPRNYPEVR